MIAVWPNHMVYTYIIFALKQIRSSVATTILLVYTYIIFALKQIDPDCISLSNMVYTYIIFALKQIENLIEQICAAYNFCSKEMSR